ncbi:MAG: MEDS domain-containing protein, partial [Actinobacteria bacterium]|nr:MEDS domain-containing protein [Actinomycetota bacterium]
MNDTGLPGVTLGDREHVCVFHRGTEERDAVLAGFFGAGFSEGDRCLCAADFPDPGTAADRLDPGHRRGPDQLTILPTDAYLTDGRFVPEDVYSRWHSVIGDYEAAGYRYVRGTGDMNWFLRDRRARGADAGPLLEYEALCNKLVKHRPATIFCFYDLDLLDADLLPGVLHHHPAALARGVLFRSWTVEERPGGANDALLLANLLLAGGKDVAQIEALLDGLRRAVLDAGGPHGPERDRFIQALPGLADPHLRAARAEATQLPDTPLRTVVVRPPVNQAAPGAHGIRLTTAHAGETAFVTPDGPEVDSLVTQLTGTGRTVGVGRARTGASAASRSYADARRAADFAAALGRPAVRHDDLGLFALLADGGDPEALANLATEWL